MPDENKLKTTRWPDLSAYGMTVRLAKFADKAMVVIEGGDRLPKTVEALGFEKVDGMWLSNGRIEQKRWLAVLPDVAFRKPAANVVKDMTDRPAPALAADRRPGLLGAMQERIRNRAAGEGPQGLEPEKKLRWIDLSAINRRIVVAARGDTRLLCIVEADGAPAADLSVFEATRHAPGLLVSSMATIDTKKVLKAIPQARVDKLTPVIDILVTPEEIGVADHPAFAPAADDGLAAPAP
jgi:hypothetical protein